jgi:hypothetical protein
MMRIRMVRTVDTPTNVYREGRILDIYDDVARELVDNGDAIYQPAETAVRLTSETAEARSPTRRKRANTD